LLKFNVVDIFRLHVHYPLKHLMLHKCWSWKKF